MEDREKKLTEKEIRILMEHKLCMLVEIAIESEYIIDKFGNLVYRNGGRARGIERIKYELKQWSEEYDIPQNKIMESLKMMFASKIENEPSHQAEFNELISILSEIGEEKKTTDADDIEKMK